MDRRGVSWVPRVAEVRRGDPCEGPSPKYMLMSRVADTGLVAEPPRPVAPDPMERFTTVVRITAITMPTSTNAVSSDSGTGHRLAMSPRATSRQKVIALASVTHKTHVINAMLRSLLRRDITGRSAKATSASAVTSNSRSPIVAGRARRSIHHRFASKPVRTCWPTRLSRMNPPSVRAQPRAMARRKVCIADESTGAGKWREYRKMNSATPVSKPHPAGCGPRVVRRWARVLSYQEPPACERPLARALPGRGSATCGDASARFHPQPSPID